MPVGNLADADLQSGRYRQVLRLDRVPVPSTYLSIRDDDGNEVPFGEAGEICAKGPQVMAGYWNRPDETRQGDDGGRLFPHRRYRRDDAGRLHQDRRSQEGYDLVSGFNVYPNEIEEVIASHPGVRGMRGDRRCGPAVGRKRSRRLSSRRTPNLTAEDVIKFCATQLTGYKVPKQIEFRTDLPKTNVGKILRRELRDRKEGGGLKRANARPMTGSAKQSGFAKTRLDFFVAYAPLNDMKISRLATIKRW